MHHEFAGLGADRPGEDGFGTEAKGMAETAVADLDAIDFAAWQVAATIYPKPEDLAHSIQDFQVRGRGTKEFGERHFPNTPP
jgi:hypothetical protein